MPRERVHPTGQLFASGALIFLSLVTTVVLAFKGSSGNPPGAVEAVALTVLAGMFQILGAATLSRTRPMDPSHVRGAVQRVLGIGWKARQGEIISQKAFESGNANERRLALGQVSVILSMVQEEARTSVDDWRSVHPEAIRELMDGQSNGQ